MNLHVKPPKQPTEAKLRYRAMEYDTLMPGDFVRCAVTGRPIRLDDLQYWSVERQEAYASAAIAWAKDHPKPKG